jgi:hypothetical protein
MSVLIINPFIVAPSSLPTTPASFVATAGDGYVFLSWASSANHTGYVVEFSADGVSFGGAQTLAASAVAAVVGSLANDDYYWFRVKATNAVGDSNWATANATPSIGLDAMGPPSNISASYNAEAIAGVATFTEAVLASYYEGELRSSGSPVEYPTSSGSPMTFSGASPNSTYEVAIRTRYGDYKSVWVTATLNT